MAAEEELEALYVRIFAKTDQFFQPMEAVRKEVGRVVASFQTITQGAVKAGVALADMATAAGGVAAAVRSINTAAGGVNVQSLVNNLSALSSSQLTNSLQALANGITAVANTDLSAVGGQLKTLNDALKQSGLGTKSIAKVTDNLRDLGKVMGGIRRVANDVGLVGLDFASGIERITNALMPQTSQGGRSVLLARKSVQEAISNLQFLTSSVNGIRIPQSRIANLNAFMAWLPQMEATLVGASGRKALFGTATAQKSIQNIITLGQAIGSLGAGLGAAGNVAANVTTFVQGLQPLSTLNTAGLNAAVQGISTSLPALGQAIRASGLGGQVGVARVVGNIVAMSQAMTALSAINPSAIINSARAMRAWFAAVGGSVNADQLKTLRQLGKLMAQFTSFAQAASAISQLPGITQNFNNSLNVTGQTATRTGGSIRLLAGDFNSLGRSMIGARTNLTLTRLTVAAFAGFGIVQFGRFDEAMAKALSRMGEFSDETRRRLGRGVLDLSTNRTTDAAHLASGLGVLTAVGMNQALAMQALPVVETHAAASGMEAATAARRLTTVLNELGLASGDATRDLQSLTRISDVFVRTSQLVDTTVEELSEAFTGRYAAAIRQVGFTLEQGVSLLSAYANAGVRGADAGNRASVLLQSLEHALIGNLHAWEALGMGVDEFTRMVHRGPAAVLAELERRLQGLGPVQQRALLERMGFESRVTQALYPLLGLSDATQRVHDNLLDLNGVAEQTANIIRNSFGGQIKMLWNTVKALGIDIGDTLAPAIGFIGRHLRTAAQWFRNLSEPMQRVVVWAALLVTVVGPVVTVFLTLGGTILGLFGTAGTVMTALTTFKALLIGIATIIAGTAVGWHNLGNAGLFALRVLGGWLDRLLLTGRHLLGFLINIHENLDILQEWLSRAGTAQDLGELGATIVANLVDNLRLFFGWFSDNWRNMVMDAGTVIALMFRNLRSGWDAFIEYTARVWEGFWTRRAGDAVRNGLASVREALAEAFNVTGFSAEQHRIHRHLRTALGDVAPPSEAGHLMSRRALETLDTGQLELLFRLARFMSDATNVREIPALRGMIESGVRPNAVVTEAARLQGLAHTLLQERRELGVIQGRMDRAFEFRLPERFHTQPLPAFNTPLALRPEQRQQAALAAALMIGNPTGMGGALATLPAQLRLPQFNTGTAGAFRRPDQRALLAQAMQLQILGLSQLSPLGELAGIALSHAGGRAGLLPAWLRLNAPHRTEGEPFGLNVPGGRSPATSFATLSEQRFVIGGPATARIEQSVRDAEGDKHLANISSILGQHLPGIAENIAEAVRPPRPAPRPATAGGTTP